MNEFLNNLSSAYWWLSVVAVGIVINLVSHFLQKKLDSQLSKASTWWQRMSDKQKRKRLEEIERLRNAQEQLLASFSELRYRIRATMYTVFGVGFMIIGTNNNLFSLDPALNYQISSKLIDIVFLAMGALSFIMGLLDHQKGWATKNLIWLARQQNEKQDTPQKKL